MDAEQRVRLDGAATVNARGEFEILAITVGQGNGWNFSADVLRASVPLWNGAEVFVDHPHNFGEQHSVRDLGGVCYNATFDDAAQGVRLTLKTLGPSGPLLDALGRELLSESTPHLRVGFSGDIGFTVQASDVRSITRVFSLDLVTSPARGGAFVRALNSVGGYSRQIGGRMADGTTPPNVTAGGAMQMQLQSEHDAMRSLLAVQQERERMTQELEAARATRAQMCAYLLDSGLGASRLPAAMQDHIRTQFTVGGAVRVFEAVELTQAIDHARMLVSALTGSATVSGVARAHAMFSSEDQIQAAVYDLLEAPRDKGTENLQVHRLRGVRELYHGLTGDFEYHGGFYPERALFATTSDFTGLVKNALNKIVVNQWEMLGRAGYDWWMKITKQEHFESLNGITGTLIGTVGTLPSVAEQGEYTELVVGDSPETATFTKYGGYIPLTLELIDRDDTRKLKAYPRELANAALRRISGLVAAVFTDNSAIGPTLADTGALFNSTAVTTAGGHANLLTTALGTTYAAWETVAAAMYNQPQLIRNATGYYGTGPKLALDPKFCLVPRALKGQAEALFLPRFSVPAELIPPSGSQTYGGFVTPLTVPEWTDATDWAAVADPLIAPAIFVGDRFGLMPEIYIAGDNQSPAVFMNDEQRLKVRLFVAVWVNDFRPLHKENVA